MSYIDKTESHGEIEGYINVDPFGRIYVDTCPTNEIHLTSSPPPGQERHTCRKYLHDPSIIRGGGIIDGLEGKRVKVRYEISIECCEAKST